MKFWPERRPGGSSPFCLRGWPRGKNKHYLIGIQGKCDECGVTVSTDESEHMSCDGRASVVLCNTCADLYFEMWQLARLVRVQ